MWWIDLWFIVKGITKCPKNLSNLVAMVTYLNENQWNVPRQRVKDNVDILHWLLAILLLFKCILLTTRFCLVLFIIVIVSQINWLSMSDIWNFKASSRFCKRWEKILRPRWKFWGGKKKKKVSFFDNTLSWKWFGPRNSAPWKSLKTQIPSNFWWFLW